MWQLSTRDGGPLECVQVKANDGNGLTVAERAAAYRAQVESSRRSGALDPCLFDTILVDEAQDLEPDELRVLLELCGSDPRTGDRNVVAFYDDAQNVYGRTRPVWNDLGIHARGRTFVMKTCFRNTRQIVEFAFNVLLGTGATSDERVRTRRFADIAYLSELGLVREEGDLVEVRFAERDDGDLPEVRAFATRDAEIDWIAGEIHDLVMRQHVRPEDILVVAEGMTPFVGLVARLEKIPGIARIVQPHRDDDKDDFILALRPRRRRAPRGTTPGWCSWPEPIASRQIIRAALRSMSAARAASTGCTYQGCWANADRCSTSAPRFASAWAPVTKPVSAGPSPLQHQLAKGHKGPKPFAPLE